MRLTNSNVAPSKVRKIILKSPISAPKLPDNFVQQSLQRLNHVLEQILNERSVAFSFEELCASVETLHSGNYSPKMYSKIESALESYLGNMYSIIEKASSRSEDIGFLGTLNAHWSKHCALISMIRSIFLHLDRKYTGSIGILSIWDLSLLMLKEKIVMKPNILNKTIRSILDLIAKERIGESIDIPCLRSIVRMLSSMSIYEKHLEPLLLNESLLFYTNERETMLTEFNPILYIDRITQRRNEENDRVNSYLVESSRLDLLNTIDRVFILEVLETFVDKSVPILMDESKIPYLGKLYNLLSRMDKLESIKTVWKDYITKEGLSQMEGDEKTLIENIISFKSKMTHILNHYFENNDQFSFSMKVAFEVFINSKKDLASELLAKYIDKMLRSGSKVSSDFELELLIDQVIQTFRYIHGKDCFEAFYKKDLAKRLILHKSLSDDAEKSLIMRLRDECGSDFTQKLEGMFKDVELSKELTADFKASNFTREDKMPIDVEIFILTTSFWPSYQPINLILPSEILELQELFAKYYLSKHHGRSLVWLNGQGLCTMRAKFAKSSKELLVSTCQAVVLMLFNDTNSHSYNDIKTASGISDEEELKRTVLSLWKHKILIKEGQNKTIEADSIFNLNVNLKTKQYRIVVNQIQIKESKQEQEKTHENIIMDRQYQIDAALVRIMKSRKTLAHNDLIVEICNQVKFSIDVSDIKKRIEILIDRGYISRSADDASIYEYVS